MKSSTKFSLVAAAVASVIGTSAQALPPSAWTDGTISAANLFYAGGGSAQVQAAYVAVSKLLVTTSIDVYTDSASTAAHNQSTNYLIVSGRTISGNTPVGFFYKYNGGAFPNGVQPFITNPTGTLKYPTTASLSTAGLIPGFSGSPTSVNPNYRFSSVLDSGDTPAWGLSNEEASLFKFPWNANGVSVPSNVTNGTPLYLSPYGIAVSKDLYAQKKNWSRADVAAVYQGARGVGGITSWSQLVADNGSPVTLAGGVSILDRGSGSGSKAAANAFFLNYPGGSFSAGGALQPASVASNSSVNVYTNTVALVTSGAATSGFQDIKEPSSVAITDDLTAAAKAGLGAIGILGLEFPPVEYQATTGTNTYFFANIDGVGPDSGTGTTDNINAASKPATTLYSNITNGRYTLAYQTGLNTNASSPPAGLQASVVANLSAASISGAATGTAFPGATPGVLLDPLTTSDTGAGNVNWSRQGNSLNAPVFIAPVNAAVGDPL